MKNPPLLGLAPPSGENGFTLIELLMTVVIAGILAAIAVPAFNNFVLSDRDSNQINSLVQSFNYARSQAVKQNSSAGVSVCPSGDGQTCDTPAAGWAGGWIVLDNSSTPSTLLQAVPALSGSNTLTQSGGVASGVTFNSSGGVTSASTTKIKICDIRGSAYAVDVEVSVVGTIISSQKGGQDANGVPLACP